MHSALTAVVVPMLYAPNGTPFWHKSNSNVKVIQIQSPQLHMFQSVDQMSVQRKLTTVVIMPYALIHVMDLPVNVPMDSLVMDMNAATKTNVMHMMHVQLIPIVSTNALVISAPVTTDSTKKKANAYQIVMKINAHTIMVDVDHMLIVKIFAMVINAFAMTDITWKMVNVFQTVTRINVRKDQTIATKMPHVLTFARATPANVTTDGLAMAKNVAMKTNVMATTTAELIPNASTNVLDTNANVNLVSSQPVEIHTMAMLLTASQLTNVMVSNVKSMLNVLMMASVNVKKDIT
jgi:hypothetical protein